MEMRITGVRFDGCGTTRPRQEAPTKSRSGSHGSRRRIRTIGFELYAKRNRRASRPGGSIHDMGTDLEGQPRAEAEDARALHFLDVVTGGVEVVERTEDAVVALQHRAVVQHVEAFD